MGETKIFVCCHGRSLMPIEYSKPPYVLIGGGGYKSRFVRLSDDTGDSVWQYNRHLNEATVLYWVANNYRPLPDFVGTAMYRHRLPATQGEPGVIMCNGQPFGCSVRAQYSACHVGIDLLLGEMKASIPDWYDDFVDFMDNTNILYRGNMFIMPRSDFIDYSLFLNRVVRMAIKLVGVVDRLGLTKSGDPRTCGYMIERLTSFWLWKRAKDGPVALRSMPMLHYDLPRVPLSAEIGGHQA